MRFLNEIHKIVICGVQMLSVDFYHGGEYYHATLAQASENESPECLIHRYKDYGHNMLDWHEEFNYNPMSNTEESLHACISMFIYREYEMGFADNDQ